VTFDDPPRQRQRQSEPAASFIERAGGTVVHRLYIGFVCNDDDCGKLSVLHDPPAFGNDCCGAEFFAQDRSENGLKSRSKSNGIPGCRRPRRVTFQRQPYLAITRLMHMLVQFFDERARTLLDEGFTLAAVAGDIHTVSTGMSRRLHDFVE